MSTEEFEEAVKDFPYYKDFERILGTSDLVSPSSIFAARLPTGDSEPSPSLTEDENVDITDVQQSSDTKKLIKHNVINKARKLGYSYKKNYSDILSLSTEYNKTLGTFLESQAQKHQQMIENQNEQNRIPGSLVDILKQEKEYQRFYSNFHLQGSNSGIQSDCTSTPSPNSPHSSSSSSFGPGSVGNIFHSF